MLIAKGKRLIGWDEILEGGLAPEATVMSWRGTEGGIAAAKQGHDVIMSPGSHLYFDAYQGDPAQEPLAIGGYLPLQKVYEFEPVPDSLTPSEAKHILGAQANLWTEYIATPAKAEYMAWPRALALAELTWSPRNARSWESFDRRLSWILPQLDRLQVSYRPPDVEGLESDRLTLGSSVRITLSNPMPSAEIRYTTDGTEPRAGSRLYVRPFDLRVTDSGVPVKARAFGGGGRSTAIASATFRHTNLAPAAKIDAALLVPGLNYTYHELQARLVKALDTARVVRSAVASQIKRIGDERPERYGIRFTGFLRVPDDDIYEFALTSDDGSNLVIDDRLVVDNDGYHGADEKRGMIALAKGSHPIVVRYAQATGGAAFSLQIRRGSGAWSDVPADWLFHSRQ
jgi:hexosaminidase